MSSRLDTYFDLSTRLAQIDDSALHSLLKSNDAPQGWGSNRIIDLDGTRVFAKAVPLTERESLRPGCTENLFQLPAYYNYGVGSAGFGVFRELATHVKTTGWVVSGSIDTFPVMYHHRILPKIGAEPLQRPGELDRYVAYWNDNPQIREFANARLDATLDLVMFIEYVPHVLYDWLPANQDKLPMVMEGMAATLSFLRAHGLIHFDAHLGNILTDGEQVFLTDFGLTQDDEFDLQPAERAFLDSHRHYDSGEFAYALTRPLRKTVVDWPDATKRALCDRFGDIELATLLRHGQELTDEGTLDLRPDYLEVLIRYREVIRLVARFFDAMRTGDKTKGGYDDKELAQALTAAGFSAT